MMKPLEDYIRTIPDYPKKGIMFRDVTSLWQDAQGFRRVIDALVHPFIGEKIDKIVGIESRGFVLGGAIAHQLSVGFVPLRKKGKLPYKTYSQEYTLEYGTDVLEMHIDAIEKGERVLIVDDLIATGGTAEAAVKLIHQVGGHIVGTAFIIDLPDLGGSEKLKAMNIPILALTSFEGH
jgi:adenine phosphoribosyltransferase